MSDSGRPPTTPGYGWEPPTGPPLAGAPASFGHSDPTNAADALGSATANQFPGSGPVDSVDAGGEAGKKVRPWWGMGDALLMVPIMALVLAVSFAVIAVLAIFEDIGFEDIGADDADLPPSMLVIPTLIQQTAWFIWPFIVSKWKGLGPAKDWGWAFKPVDIGIGVGTAMIALFAAGIAGTVTSALVDLEDESLAENTRILTDYENSPWLFALLFIVVIGAPFSEELLFRGLIMRSIQKRWGVVAGVIGSLLIFVPIHLADGGLFTGGQLVLWASIAVLGGVLSIAAVMTERLAAPIIAHMIINGIGSAGALGYLDALTDQLPS